MNKANERNVQLYRYEDDEISFLDLYRILVKRKLLIILVFAVTLLGAILYLAIVQPVYEAKLKLLVAKPTSTILTIPPHSYGSFDPGAVFEEFQAHLKLTELWSTFVANNPDLFKEITKDETAQVFAETPIRFGQDKNFPAKHVEVHYQHHSSTSATEILQNYLAFVRESYVTDLISAVTNRIEREKENIELDVVMMKKRAELARGDEIERLRQDLALAKELGITDNLLVRSSEASRLGSDIAIIATNETVRSYMRGTNVLGAELEALLNRKSNDPYINGLREKQIELERLNSLRISSEDFMPYSQDGEIFSARDHIWPRKTLVLLFAVVLGLILAALVVYLVESLAKYREDKNTSSVIN